jgi:hypothetical protein
LSARCSGLARLAAGLALLLGMLAPAAADTQRLVALLHEFMAGASVNDVGVHQRFWDDELVYTSSAGTRFGKAEILAGLADRGDSTGPVYAAEEIDVRLHGSIAVITFLLVARHADDRREHFYNTGVFRLRDGEWRAVTWQATRRAPSGP